MDTDFVFIVSYSCPRCHAALESRSFGPPRWVRCPGCGRACLPPEQDRVDAAPYLDDPALILGPVSTFGASAASGRAGEVADLPGPPAPPPAPATPTARLLLGSGFFLSMALFVFSLLDAKGGLAGLFGASAILCLIFLTRRPGRPSPE